MKCTKEQAELITFQQDYASVLFVILFQCFVNSSLLLPVQVSLFAELFNEMLQRDFGVRIYRSLLSLPDKEDKKDKKNKKDEKKEKKEERDDENDDPKPKRRKSGDERERKDERDDRKVSGH